MSKKKFVLSFVTLYLGVSIEAMAYFGIDFNVSQESVHFDYYQSVGSEGFARKELYGGFLYNNDKNYLVEAGLQIVDETGDRTPGLEAGIGPKIFIGSTDITSDYYTSIAIGGLLDFRPRPLNRFLFELRVNYSPNIISWGTNHFFEAGARMAYEIVQEANIYIGYQYLETSDVIVENGPHLGIYMRF